jgi:beta-glucosidase
MELAGSEARLLEKDGVTFRDLNRNGEPDVYEDRGQPVAARVEDLLSRMTLEEKAGMMFHNMIGMRSDGRLVEGPSLSEPLSFMGLTTSEMILVKKLNTFNVFRTAPPREMAGWYNRLQKRAERTRLGIPVTISSDLRHGLARSDVATFTIEGFSKWPHPIGLAATRDTSLVYRFGDIARQEYRAVGIRVALHPMADLATEPRWSRINGTFGEDAELSAAMLRAYIRGFQSDTLGAKSVACMTKHFSGGGPQKDGEDPHFAYGKEQIYPGGNFDYHLIPFEQGAFPAHTTQIMPYYGIPVGQASEDVGFAFNKNIITGLLRERYGFDGVVCSDWGIISQQTFFGVEIMPSAGWGVEHLSAKERLKKAIDAGVDQFGGSANPELIVEMVKEGRLNESRIDQSVRRILRDKFTLGLFDNPYIDERQVDDLVGGDEFLAAGELAQRQSLVLLKNGQVADSTVLPLRGRPRVYVENLAPDIVSRYAEVVQNLTDADLALLRIDTPSQPYGGFIKSLFHRGDLDFKEPEKSRLIGIMRTKPTIVDIYLDRPAVIPEIVEEAAGIVADFGANDAAVLDVIFGSFRPMGKLPFELPSSMEAVGKQREDVPYDSEAPLFPFGFSLSYD